MKDYYFIRKWKKQTKDKILLVHPEYDEKKLDDYLEQVIHDNFKDRKCEVRNTYREKILNSSLLNIVQYIHDRKPILGGYGVMYLNQKDSFNPNALMLMDSLNRRKEIKKDRKKYDKRSYEFMVRDIAQANEKVIANSFYGSNGTKTSTFYNKDIASSVTATGQAEISTAETGFESLIANNTPFYDMDECLLYMRRIVDEEYKYTDFPKIDEIYDKLFERLHGMFFSADKVREDILTYVIQNLSYEDCVKIYLKNNLFAFFHYYKPVRKLMKKIINKTKSFRDPNNIPEEIKDDLTQVFDYLNTFCVYNYTVRNRIERDKYHHRRVCVTQDTDSTMLTLRGLMNFFIDEFAEDEVAAENQSEFDFILVNTICSLLTEYTHRIFRRYCEDVHILEDYIPLINMKNEFYYPILLDTDSKKHYITLTKLQEGVEIKPPKIEIHGLEMAKAETSEYTKNFFFNIIKEDIMYADKINVSEIMRKIQDFKLTIRHSLESRKKEFLPLKSVKEMEAYDHPYSEQGVRAARTWNLFYPDLQINLPDKFLVLAIACEKKKQFDALEIPPKYREIIEEKIFNYDDKSIRTSGFNIIAIPQNVELIPEWLVPLIDYDKIILDNVSKFNQILKSLGAVTLKTRANCNHMSNIIAF